MDQAAADLAKEKKDLPEELASLRSDVGMLEQLLQQERSQLDEARELRAERREALQARVEGLSRAKAKASQARSLKESSMAEREVETNRKAIKDREEEVAKLDAALETKESALGEREKQFQESREILEDEEKRIAERLAVIDGDLGVALAGRDELIAKVPRRIDKRYEKLKTRDKYQPVTFIETETCQSCRFALPPQLFIEVQKGKEIHTCPICHAYVIYTPLVDGPSADAAPEASEAPEGSSDA